MFSQKEYKPLLHNLPLHLLGEEERKKIKIFQLLLFRLQPVAAGCIIAESMAVSLMQCPCFQ